MAIVLRLYANLLKIDPDIQLLQVKEKLGGLRVYYQLSDLDRWGRMVEAYVRAAQEEALEACEICGSTKSVSAHNDMPEVDWIRTLCEMHHQQRRREQSNG